MKIHYILCYQVISCILEPTVKGYCVYILYVVTIFITFRPDCRLNSHIETFIHIDLRASLKQEPSPFQAYHRLTSTSEQEVVALASKRPDCQIDSHFQPLL